MTDDVVMIVDNSCDVGVMTPKLINRVVERVAQHGDSVIVRVVKTVQDVLELFQQCSVIGCVIGGGERDSVDHDTGVLSMENDAAAVSILICRSKNIPVLGICLGMQIIAAVLGGRVSRLSIENNNNNNNDNTNGEPISNGIVTLHEKKNCCFQN